MAAREAYEILLEGMFSIPTFRIIFPKFRFASIYACASPACDRGHHTINNRLNLSFLEQAAAIDQQNAA